MTVIGLSLMLIATLIQAQVLPIVLPQLIGADLRPHLLVLLVVAITLIVGVREGIIWGFAGGLLLDIFSPLTPLGTNALCLVLVALLASLGLAIPLRASLVMPLVMVAIATLFYFVLLMIIRTLFGVHMDWAVSLARLALPAAAINAALMPLCYTLLGWISDRFQPKLPEEWQTYAQS
jgi:rod shape-determining protein MreD